MRKRRPSSYNPEQTIDLVSGDRKGAPIAFCPSCSGRIERLPQSFPPPPASHVTLRCTKCGRSAHYVAGAA